MNIKEKALGFAVKHDLPGKARKVSNAVCAGSAAAAAASVMSVPCHAIDWGMTVTADSAVQYIVDGVSPFTEPAIIILCAVSGIRLGMRLIKSSSH